MRTAMSLALALGALGCGEDAGHVGEVHVEWALERADGTAGDCLTPETPLMEISVLAKDAVLRTDTYYCVNMSAVITDLPRGGYTVALRLRNLMNETMGTARADVEVGTGHGARTGTLLIRLR